MKDFRLAEGTTKLRYLFETQRNWAATGNTAAWFDHGHVSLSEYKIWMSGGTNLHYTSFGDIATDIVVHIGEGTDGALDITKNAKFKLLKRRLYVGSSEGKTGTVNVTGGTLQMTGVTATSMIGSNGNGVVNLTDGATWTTEGGVRVGTGADVTGTVNIEDGSVWETYGNAYIGDIGGSMGSVFVRNGKWISTGADNYISLYAPANVYIGDKGEWKTSGHNWIGKNSAFIKVDGGILNSYSSYEFYLHPNAEIEVVNGGTWNAAGAVSNGTIAITDSTVNAYIFDNWNVIDLNHSSWNGGLSAGKGPVSFTNNSQFNTSGTVIVSDGAVFDLDHSSWTGNAKTYIGKSGSGLLKVRNDSSLVTGGTLYIANSNTTGRLNLNDSDWTAKSDVYVGNGGSAYLDISNNSTFTAEKRFKINRNSTFRIRDDVEVYLNRGIETADSADLPTDQCPTITGRGTIYIGDGYTLDLNNGTQVLGTSYTARLYIEGSVTGYGYLKNVTVGGDILGDDNEYGVLDVQGLRIKEGNSLKMKIGGLEAGTEHDQIFFVGNMQVQDATLNIVLCDDFMPALDDSFTLFALNGNEVQYRKFATINLPEFDNSWMEWDISELYSAGVITVVPEPTTLTMLGLAIATMLRRRRLG